MLLSELIRKYQGHQVDWDDCAGAQCVDWVKMYIQECIGIKTKGKGTSPWGDAKEYWYHTPSVLFSRFAKIRYEDNFCFIEGDIVIWNTGKYGHVAIATGKQDDNTFYTYDQNYGKDKSIRRVCHNRSSSILGVLRPYRKVLWDVNIRTKPSLSGAITGEKLKGQQVLPLWLDESKKWCRLAKGSYIAYKSLEEV